MKNNISLKNAILIAIVVVLILAAAWYLRSLKKGAKESAAPRFDAVVASDIHFISPTINDRGEMFQRLLAGRDAKTTLYCEELTDSFLNEVIERKPEVLILTGDLAFNGAVQSHVDFAARLKRVEDAGITVLVLPGNHDVYCSNAAIFHGDSYDLTDSPTSEGFKEIYADFGYNEALSVDEMSASYMYDLNDTTRVLMLDANTAEHPCEIAPSTFKWMKKQLKKAKKDGKYILAGIHQNLLIHNEMFVDRYVINNSEEVAAQFRKFGVKLTLTGHMHNQNFVTSDGVSDLASSALSVYPCQYGILTTTDNSREYEAVEGDVKGVDFDFKEFASKCMDRMSNPQRERFIESGMEEEQMETLLSFFGDINRMYFSGDMTHFDDLLNSDVMKEYLSVEGNHNLYIDLISKESGNDYRRFSIDTK
ncbi:MAG: metallophosphoesterase [Lachnospiraceae bacterium]|nr:metallophosphoesterase [Lachnospiraceae bacterium]